MYNTSLYFQALNLASEFRTVFYLTRDKSYYSTAFHFIKLARLIRQRHHLKFRLP